MISLIEIDVNTWHKHWKNVSHAHILQSWEYGQAKHYAQRWRARRFLLQDDQMKPQGLLQALCFSLPCIGGVARINRGPVFFSDSWWHCPSQDGLREVMTAILNAAKRYRWWYLSVAPNFLANDETFALLEQLGFHRKNYGLGGSALVSVDKRPEEIRAGFHSAWRRNLKKSEKMDLELEIPSIEEGLPYLLNEYEKMQREKQFRGNPTRVLYQMVKQQGPTWNPRVLFVRHNGERVGGIMFVGCGDTFIYLVGWLPEAGRHLQANYFLFWNALLLFRDLGYKFFDVGGLGPGTTEGVARFKRKMKGEEYFLVGEHWHCILPIPFKNRKSI